MKNYLKLFLFSAVALLAASCDPAEAEYKYEEYVDNIYTVNKATVEPEFADTSYFVDNIDSYGLKTGDRARMVMHFYHDAYSGVLPKWSIVQLVEVIPTREILPCDSAVLAEYTTPLDRDFYETSEKFLYPQWVWKNRLNVNVKFKGVADGADFRLMLRGVSEGCVEFDLVAKVSSSTSVNNTKLLTFDLSKVGGLLTAEQKLLLESNDSLNTKIYHKYENADSTINERSFFGGKFKKNF